MEKMNIRDAENRSDDLKIRKTTEEDLPRLMQIYAFARKFMSEHGNPNQWGPTNWPPEAVIRADIQKQISYVCVDETGHIVATFVYVYGEDADPSYRDIENGCWTKSGAYGVVHRMASDGSRKGIGQFCLDWAYRQCGHMRIDTHADNTVMQRLLFKMGFQKTGIIHVVEDDNPRYSYEKYDFENEENAAHN